MIAVAIVCFPIFFTGQQIARWEGGLFLAYYSIYTLYRVLSESQATIADTFGTVLLACDSADRRPPADQSPAGTLQPTQWKGDKVVN